MDELTQMPSRFGIWSLTLAVLDIFIAVIGVAAILLVWSYFPKSVRLPLTYLSMAILALFPIVALVGLVSGIRELFLTEMSKIWSLVGVALNIIFLIISAIVLFFVVNFDANRFRM